MIAVYADNEVSSSNQDYSFIKVEEDPWVTLKIIKDDGTKEDWKGEGFHAGIFGKTVKIVATDIPEDIQMPDTSYLYITMTDMYGKKHSEKIEKDAAKAFFSQITDGMLDEITKRSAMEVLVSRGGIYSAEFGFVPVNYLSRDTLEVVDEPSLTMRNLYVELGKDLNATADFCTGYPFDMDSLTGKESAKYVIYSYLNDSTKVETGYSGFKALNLKDEAHPLIAGWDSMAVKMPCPSPGRYQIEVTSDWATGNKVFGLIVRDTIKVATLFDKAEYTLGEDKVAKMNVHMEYGYPYIAPTESYPVPTVALKTTLMNETDSLVFASDTLASKALNHDAEVEIDLSKITSDYLAEHNDSVNLTLNILFSGANMYSKKCVLTVKQNSTGIKTLKLEEKAKSAIYTIDGVKLNCNKEALPKGLYIINGKKEIIK